MTRSSSIRLRGALLLALCAAAPWLVAAAAAAPAPQEMRTVYVVELIVFAHQAGLAGSEERWPPELELPAWQDAVLPRDPNAGPEHSDTVTADPDALPAETLVRERPPVWVTTPEQLKLAAVLARLQRDPRYEVLLHSAWQQDGLPEGDSFQVLISDVPMDMYFEPADGAAEDDAQAMAAGMAADIAMGRDTPTQGSVAMGSEDEGSEPRGPASPFDDPSARLVGLVRLYLERYLHLQLDLVYDTGLEADASQLLIPAPVETTDAAADARPEDMRADASGDDRWDAARDRSHAEADMVAQTLRVRLTESRRMRSTEVHYFDHPVLGVIATITPWEIPVEPASAPAATRP